MFANCAADAAASGFAPSPAWQVAADVPVAENVDAVAVDRGVQFALIAGPLMP